MLLIRDNVSDQKKRQIDYVFDNHTFGKIGSFRLSNQDFEKICSLRQQEGYTYRKLSEMFNVSPGRIGQIVRGGGAR